MRLRLKRTMLSRKQAQSVPPLKMRGKEVFEATTSFPPRELPPNKEVIERMLNFPDY